MRCDQIMSSTVRSIEPEQSAERAANVMRELNIGFLPVCDPSNRVVGVLTDRDLAVRVLAQGKPGSTPVKEVMTTELCACAPSDPLEKAEELMARRRKSRVVLVDRQGRLAGVISLADIARKERDAPAARVLRELKQPDGVGASP